MTYKQLFKQIDDHTKKADGVSLIDGLILEYGIATAMDAIDYTAYFVGTSSFKAMTYWVEYPKKPIHYAISKIASALIPLYPMYETELTYLINRFN